MQHDMSFTHVSLACSCLLTILLGCCLNGCEQLSGLDICELCVPDKDAAIRTVSIALPGQLVAVKAAVNALC